LGGMVGPRQYGRWTLAIKRFTRWWVREKGNGGKAEQQKKVKAALTRERGSRNEKKKGAVTPRGVWPGKNN